MTSYERTLIALRGGQPDRVPIQLFGTQGYSVEMENYGENYRRLLAYARRNADMLYVWSEPLEQCVAGMFSGVEIKKHIEHKNEIVIRTLTMETPNGTLTQVSESDTQTVSDLKLRKPFVENDEDFERLMSIPSLPFRPDLSGYFNLCKHIGNKGVVTIHLLSPIGIAGLYLRPTEFIFWTIE